ncbi:IS66 family insertion sequence element accessory protein TnpB [Desulfoglaeba alkanexedens]|uniref:Transposase n=1 Tax=Desulfoglaeba alkanexedens ALDC TaxID=980445 RepID=A0A4P8L218_9BACT|nr:transposase [Desulfoglaeba alkanexedens ALDC]
MRKAVHGLSVLVDGHLELDPFSGHWFVFCNRARTIIKILYWGQRILSLAEAFGEGPLSLAGEPGRGYRNGQGLRA